ncbi:MAG: glycosyltransferase [Caldilineaceae bacterium]|nr:glycosyltransferase [Caldilineaceae bacterium]
MDILLLTPQLPYPPRQGTTIRNLGIIQHLAQRHSVDLATFLAPGESLTPNSPLHTLCRRVIALPQPVRPPAHRLRDTLLSPLPDMALRLEDWAMHRAVQSLVAAQPYDILQVEGIELAQYARHAPPATRVVFDDHNCEYLLQQRAAQADLRTPRRWHAAAYSLIQTQKLRRYEAAACRAAAAVIAVSHPDAAALARIAPGTAIEVIPNGIDLAAYAQAQHAPPQTGPFTLLFTGKMDYRPNVDAMLWFGQEVLPRLLAQTAGLRCQIVGLNPHPRLDVLRAIPQVEITGGVPDVRPYLAAAHAYIIPMRVGGGTRFKALEAMACAKPIVSTSLGVEGIDVHAGQELLIADTPEQFAASVLQLMYDYAQEGVLAARLGAAACRFVAARYTWERILPQLETLYTALLPIARA